jgi:hypothetical protein
MAAPPPVRRHVIDPRYPRSAGSASMSLGQAVAHTPSHRQHDQLAWNLRPVVADYDGNDDLEREEQLDPQSPQSLR